MIFVAVALPALVLRSPSVARPKPTLVMQSVDVRPGSMKEATILQGKRPYGEESRRYRRTVYRHADWIKHRSETRLLRNLKGTFTSGVVRSLHKTSTLQMVVSLRKYYTSSEKCYPSISKTKVHRPFWV